MNILINSSYFWLLILVLIQETLRYVVSRNYLYSLHRNWIFILILINMAHSLTKNVLLIYWNAASPCMIFVLRGIGRGGKLGGSDNRLRRVRCGWFDPKQCLSVCPKILIIISESDIIIFFYCFNNNNLFS